MKIAFAMINCNRRDGSARPVNEVAERLAGKHQIDLFARKVEDIDLRKINWHPVPGLAWPEVADFASYHRFANRRLSRHDYDVVHSIGCNTLRANVVTIQNIQPAKSRVLKRLGQPDSVSLPRRVTRWLYRYVTSRAERRLYTANARRQPILFLPVSKGVEGELRQFYDIGSAQVCIVPNAADTSVFTPVNLEERTIWREVNGFASSDVVLIFSGGEWVRKGLKLAIAALAKLHDVRTKLFVAGDDPARERFEQLARELGVADRVTFGGFRNDIAKAFASSDLFLFPSWYEAFSLATIEAAACGLPVVATKINGTEDFIEPGLTGEFIHHDAEQIASVLKPLINCGDLRARMGQNARQLVEEKYTWDRVAALTENAYLDFLQAEGENKRVKALATKSNSVSAV